MTFQKVGLLREDGDKCLAFLAVPKLMYEKHLFQAFKDFGCLKAETFVVWTLLRIYNILLYEHFTNT